MTKFKKRKRDLSDQIPQPKSGAKPTHGGFAAVKMYRERKLDLRKKDDRALKAWQMAIVDDLGGPTSLDMLQNSLLDRSTELLIILRCMAEHVEKKGVIADDGNLQPCLKSSYIAYANSFRRMLETIYSRQGAKPPKIKTLKDILEAGDKDE